jgi:hypothetical protein
MLYFDADKYKLRITDGSTFEWRGISVEEVRLHLSEKWPEIVVALGLLPDLDNFAVQFDGTRIAVTRLDDEKAPEPTIWNRLSVMISDVRAERSVRCPL